MTTHLFVPLACLLGVFLHRMYFHYDRQHYARSWLYLSLVLLFAPVTALVLSAGFNAAASHALSTLVLTEALCLLSLFTSVLTYRLSPFHRLAHFPGPLAERMSKLARVWRNRSLNLYQDLPSLHERYGEVMRTGPAEVSVANADIARFVLGPRSPCFRPTYFEGTHGPKSLVVTGEIAKHKSRRKAWGLHFNSNTLKAYEGRIDAHALVLGDQLAKCGGEAVDASSWFKRWSCDVMSDLTFGQPFDMLLTGRMNSQAHFVHYLLQAYSRLGPSPWLFYMASTLGTSTNRLSNFCAWCDEMIGAVTKLEKACLLSWLESSEHFSQDPLEKRRWMYGDIIFAIAAGELAMSATVSWLFYHLAQDPAMVARIREEIRATSDVNGVPDPDTLREARYLNAVIIESLRLHPPNPSGVVRRTPSEGICVGDTRIPGDTNVWVPFIALHHSPANFVQPLAYIPERWTTRPDLNLKPHAWVPFSAGAYGCIGQNLGLLEIRTVVAHLLMRFDVAFAPGEDGTGIQTETQDISAMVCGPMMLKFVTREDSKI